MTRCTSVPRVRAPFHGRTVRGWVVDEDVGTPPGVEVLPLKSWLGWGPPRTVVELAAWAAWRWAGPASFFLRTASPENIVRGLPVAPPMPAADPSAPRRPELDLAQPGVTVVREPPLADPIQLVLSVVEDDAVRARNGSVLVLVPSAGWADAADGSTRTSGVADGGHVGAGPRRLARRRREPGQRLGPRTPAGRGGGARCPRCRLPGGERSDLQRRRRPDRTGRTRERALRSGVAGAPGGAGGGCRLAHRRPFTSRRTGGMAGPGAGRPPRRRPA